MQMKTVRITAADGHKHAGRKVPKGTQLVMREAAADWLVEQGVAEPVGWNATRAALLTPPAAPLVNKPKTPAPAKAPARTGCRGCGWTR